MSTYKKQFKQSPKSRRNRRFSDNFKKDKVKEIESAKSTVMEICKAYEVSATSVYRWLEKYSTRLKPERTIVESKSDTQKILALQKKLADLERKLGQKQIELEFNEKLIELAEKRYRIEIKKKPGLKP